MFHRCQSLIFVLILIAYLFFGAFIFKILEHENEKENMDFVRFLRRDIKGILLRPIAKDICEHSDLHRNLYFKSEFSQRVAVVKNLSKYGGQDLLSKDFESAEKPNKWNFFNSLFYVVTIVTTIGYGNFAPKTPNGKFFTVIYAFIGIPLSGIIIKMLMDIFVKRMRGRYKRFKTEKVTQRKIGFVYNLLLLLALGFSVFVFIPSGVFVLCEDWAFLDSVYFSFTSLMTIGLGDYVPGIEEGDSFWKWVYKIFIILWLFGGLGYLCMILTFITDQVIHKKVHRVIRTVTRRVHMNDNIEKKEMNQDEIRDAIEHIMGPPVINGPVNKNSQLTLTKDYLIKWTDVNKKSKKISFNQDYIKSRRHSETEIFQAEKKLEQNSHLMELIEKLVKTQDKDDSKQNLKGNDPKNQGHDNNGFKNDEKNEKGYYEIIEQIEEYDVCESDDEEEGKKRRKISRKEHEKIMKDSGHDLENVVVVSNDSGIGSKVMDTLRKISHSSSRGSHPPSRKISRNEGPSRKISKNSNHSDYTNLNATLDGRDPRKKHSRNESFGKKISHLLDFRHNSPDKDNLFYEDDELFMDTFNRSRSNSSDLTKQVNNTEENKDDESQVGRRSRKMGVFDPNFSFTPQNNFINSTRL